MTPTTAIILAGGQGSRIRNIYPDIPKPLIPIHGRPFLYWSTALIAHHGLTNFLYAAGIKGEQVDKWCQDQSMPGLSRITCLEPEPLGTGGGLLNCIEHCTGWVLVANGDSLCLKGIAQLLTLSRHNRLAGALLGVNARDAGRRGNLAIDNQGQLLALRENADGMEYINGGVYLFHTDTLKALQLDTPCSIERHIIPRILQTGEQFQIVRLDKAPFIDIGTPETIGNATPFVRSYIDHFTWQT